MIAFGPVPSRRLGYSLGINHIPPKHCSYSCVYCQVGRTNSLITQPKSFYSPAQILKEVEAKLTEAEKAGRATDYLTLVPDGEPTLDLQLNELIEQLKRFRIPIAVISNASLIDRDEIREALDKADWVSMKVDSVVESEWRAINRPSPRLSLVSILSGIMKFHHEFSGELVTETMLVDGINHSEESLRKLCDYLLELQPFKVYLSIPTRPPAEPWVKPPDAKSLQRILDFTSTRIPFLDILFESEPSDFVSTGNLIEDILSTTAVHPIREEALLKMITKAGGNRQIIENLVSQRQIECIQYRSDRFFMRTRT